MFKRTNGLYFPWSFKQCLSYFAYMIYGLTYNIFVIFYLPPNVKYIFYPAFNLLLLTSLCLHLTTAYTNPADPHIYSPLSINSEFPIIHRCSICKSPIQLFSKHCTSCNKCIYKYDHHCFWVNNCIGGKNYKIFFAMVISNTLLAFTTSISCIIVLENTILLSEDLDDNIKITFIFFIVFSGSFSLLATLYFTYILIFHMYMCYLGLTTYEYLIKKRNRTAVLPSHRVQDWERSESANTCQNNIRIFELN